MCLQTHVRHGKTKVNLILTHTHTHTNITLKEMLEIIYALLKSMILHCQTFN